MIGPYPVETDKIVGGVAAVTYYLAQGLVKESDLELHVISSSKLVTEERTVHHDGMTVHYLAHRKNRLVPNLLRDIVRLRPFLRELAPDIVHSQTAGGAIAAAQEGLPRILTIHGIPHREIQFARNVSERWAARLQAWLARTALNRVDTAIAISPYVTEAYAEFRHITWHHIHNPIEDRFFAVNGDEVLGKMLFAGVIHQRKNLPGLVRAFARVCAENPQAELYICGKIREPEIIKEVERFIGEHGLERHVHILGFVSQEELARHFAEAALIGMFSEEETAPMIIAQAMAACKPSVATAAGGVPYLMRDGETGYVVAKGDEKTFADRTVTLLADDELRARMGQRGRELAEDLFRAEAVASRTRAVYEQVLAGKTTAD
ncbi:MAG: glycosyltransferase family 4 protein [bacterium]